MFLVKLPSRANAPVITTSDNPLNITTDIFSLDFFASGFLGSLDAGTNTITILSSTASALVGLDGNATPNASAICGGACDLVISGGELQNITAANLIIGDNTLGKIFVDDISATDSANISAVTLNTGTDVELSGTASNFTAFTVNASGTVDVLVDLNVAGPLDVAANTAINVTSADITSQGTTVYSAPTITIDTVNLNSTNNPLTAITDNLASPGDFISSTISSGTASITLLPFTPAAGLDIGSGPGILSSLINPAIFFTASSLILGDAATGAITVNDALINSLPVFINSGSTVTFTGNPSSFFSLDVNAAQDVIFDAFGDLNITSGDLSIISTTGAITMADGSVVDAGAGTITFEATDNIILGLLTTTHVDLITDVVGLAVDLTSTTGSVLDTTPDPGNTTDVNSPNGVLSVTATSGSFGTGGNPVEVVTLQTRLDVASAGISSPNGINIATAQVFNDATIINADDNNDGVGTLAITALGSVTTNNNTLTLIAADFDIQGSVTSGTANTIVQVTNGGTLGLGDANCGSACNALFTGAELQQLTAENLTFGDGTTGNVFVDNVLAVDTATIAGTVSLATGANITFTNVASTFKTLTATANNNIVINTGLSTSVGGMAFSPTTGVVDVNADLATNGSLIDVTGGTGTVEFGTNVTIDSGLSAVTANITSGTTTLNGITTLNNLSLTSGALAGTGNVTVDTAFTFNNATLSGAGLFQTTGTATTTLAPTFQANLSGREWENLGTVNWTGSNTSSNFALTGAGALFDNQGDFNILATDAGAAIFGTGTFINAGTVTKSSSVLTTISTIFNNTNQVEITGGLLRLQQNGTDTGTYSVANGTVLQFAGGTRNFDSGADVTALGSGDVRFLSGTTNFNTGSNFSISSPLSITGGAVNFNPGSTVSLGSEVQIAGGGTANFDTGGGLISLATLGLTGGTLTGGDAIDVTSTFTFNNSTLSGNGLFQTTGTATTTLSATNISTLDGREWENLGTVNWVGVSNDDFLLSGAGALFDNQGIFNIQAADVGSNILGAGTFANSGTVTKSSNITTNILSLFNNTGQVNVTDGTLLLTNGGTDTGVYNISAGSFLQFAGGTRTLDNGANFTGDGTAVLASTLTVNAGATVPFSNLQMTGAGTLTGAGDVTVDSAFTINGGTLSGTGLFQTTATAITTLSATAITTLDGKEWENLGTVNWVGVSNDDFVLSGAGALFDNQGIFNIQVADVGSSILGAGTFDNSGAVTKLSVVDTTIFTVFNNTGTVNVNNGVLNLTNGGTDTGTYDVIPLAALNFTGGTRNFDDGLTFSGLGIINLTGGTINITGAGVGATIASDATLVLDNRTLGGTGLLTNEGTFVAQGTSAVNGTLVNNGTFTVRGTSAGNSDFTVGLGFNNSGTVNLTNIDGVARNATLSVGGTLTNNAAGTINLLEGTGGGDRTLSASSNLILDGGLTSDTTNSSLTSGNNIQVNNTVTTSLGINLTATGNVLFNASGNVAPQNPNDIADVTISSSSGAITMADGAEVDAGAGTITFNANGDITLGLLTTTHVDLITDVAGLAVDLTSTTGSVLDTTPDPGNATDVNSPNGVLSVTATSGSFGTGGNPVEVATLQTRLDVASAAISSPNGIDITTARVFNDATIINADNDFDGVGTLAITAAGSVTTNNNTLTLIAADFDIQGSVTSGTANTIVQVTNGRTLGLGDANCGSVCDASFNGAELQQFTVANITFGDGTTGNVFVDNVLAADTATIQNTVSLATGANITFTNVASTFKTLTATANNNIVIDAGLSTSAGGMSFTPTTGVVDVNADLSTNGSLIDVTAGTGTVEFGTSATLDAPLNAVTANITAGTTTLNGVTTLNNLSLTSGALAGTGDVTVDTAFTFNNATLSGTGLFQTTGTATTGINSGNSVFLTGRTWTNEGTVNFFGSGGGDFRINSSGIFNNVGEFNLLTTGLSADILTTTVGTFNNIGTLTKNVISTDATLISTIFNNSGTVNNESSLIRLNNDGTDTGVYNLDSGSSLAIIGGIRNLDDGVTFTGLGNTNILGGAVNLVGATTGATIAPDATVTLNNVTLGDTGILNNNGTLIAELTSGASGILNNNGTFRIQGTNAGDTTFTLGTDFINAGTLEMTSTGTGRSAILNVSGGSFTLPGAGIINVLSGSGGGSRTISAGANIVMDGTLITDRSVNVTANNDVIFGSTGAIQVQASADIADVSIVSTTGAITMADGAVVDAGAGTITFNANGDITLGLLTTTSNSALAVGLTTLGDVLDGDLTGADDVVAVNGTLVVTAVDFGPINPVEVNAAVVDLSGVSGSAGVSSANGIDITTARVFNAATIINADNDFDGVGTLAITAAGSVTTNNNTLTLIAADFDIQGSVTSGTANTIVQVTNGGTLGLGDANCGSACQASLTGAEQQLFNAGNLTFGSATGGSIFVDNVQAVDTATIADSVTLVSGADITFSGTASTFKALTATANNGIDFQVGLTTSAGILALDGDANNATDGADGISFANGVILASAGLITLDATTGGMTAAGALTLNGVGISINDNLTGSTGAGNFIFNASTGEFAVNGADVISGDNEIFVTADQFAIASSLNSGSASTTIVPSTPGTSIGLGTGSGILSLTDVEIDSILTASLIIGDASSGAIIVDGVTVINNLVTLNSGTLVAFSVTPSSFQELSLFAPDVNVNANVSVSGALGGFSATGIGTFAVGPAATISSSGSVINIFMNDIDLQGFLNSGNGSTIFVPFDISSIGIGDATICNGTTCDTILDKTELSNITAGNLEIGFFDSNITIDNVANADLAGISGTVFFDATAPGGTVDFVGPLSTFSALDITSSDNILVNGSVDANSGNFVATAGGDFTLALNTTVSAAGNITVTAANVVNQNANLFDNFNAVGTVTLNGLQPPAPPPPPNPNPNPVPEPEVEQATNAAENFFDEFANNRINCL